MLIIKGFNSKTAFRIWRAFVHILENLFMCRSLKITFISILKVIFLAKLENFFAPKFYSNILNIFYISLIKFWDEGWMSLCIFYYQFVAAYDRYVEYEHQIPPKFSKEFPSNFFYFFFLFCELS